MKLKRGGGIFNTIQPGNVSGLFYSSQRPYQTILHGKRGRSVNNFHETTMATSGSLQYHTT